ncbi:MAG: ATP-binding cassette domain-containing protein [Firmicutes bacterium]|nr:ATP-binding cassette domain-containing protein [Bacillota bacterium]
MAKKNVTQEKKETIIEIKNIIKKFGDVTILDDVNLSIKRGDFVTLLGPSGCGKTTLLRLIAGFDTPTDGAIFIGGNNVTMLPPHKRPVNTVFQKYALFPHLNVFGNIAFGLKLAKIPDTSKPAGKNGKIPTRKWKKAEIKEKVEKALTLVGLEGYGHRDTNSLSGGQQQRVAIARAIVCEPKVLLLDEPLGALDLKMRKEMQVELMNMHRNLGITFVYVTHDQEEALTMSDKIAVMRDGVIQQLGTPKQIYDEPQNAFVADFIGESNILSGTMIKDFVLEFAGAKFTCEDKGFGKGENVDIVIRPEDIYIMDADNPKGMLKGEVVSVIFKGTYYEIEVKNEGYQFTVQDTASWDVGDKVTMYIRPHDIHVMKKAKTINSFDGVIKGADSVQFLGATYEIAEQADFEAGDEVTVKIEFDNVELTDHPEDAPLSGRVTDTLYKGKYYQVQVYVEDADEFFLLNTNVEWDNGDQVGILVKAEDIQLEKRTDSTETAD